MSYRGSGIREQMSAAQNLSSHSIVFLYARFALATAVLIVLSFLSGIRNDYIGSKTIVLSWSPSFQYIIKNSERRVDFKFDIVPSHYLIGRHVNC